MEKGQSRIPLMLDKLVPFGWDDFGPLPDSDSASIGVYQLCEPSMEIWFDEPFKPGPRGEISKTIPTFELDEELRRREWKPAPVPLGAVSSGKMARRGLCKNKPRQLLIDGA